jgi:hypothetical protein
VDEDGNRVWLGSTPDPETAVAIGGQAETVITTAQPGWLGRWQISGNGEAAWAFLGEDEA